MRLALAQMKMSPTAEENLVRAERMMCDAAAGGAGLVLFPEVMLSPFFAAEPGKPAAHWLMDPDGPEVRRLRGVCRELGLWASPNLYLRGPGGTFDTSLLIDGRGELRGTSRMVHIYQAENFYEKDYYTPSPDGFHVWDTPFGKIGTVICFDRHLPESVRTCALRGAQLVLIPTANIAGEPLELFEWEVRVQAFHGECFIAMCNRVGPEGNVTFAGQSLVAAPDGGLIVKAGSGEGVIFAELDLAEAGKMRAAREWLPLLRPECYAYGDTARPVDSAK